MFLFVICFNCGLALCNVLLAIGLYFLYRQLQRLTQKLNSLEHCCHQILSPTPELLLNFTKKNKQLRQRYNLLVKRWSMLQGVLQIWQFANKNPKVSSLVND